VSTKTGKKSKKKGDNTDLQSELDASIVGEPGGLPQEPGEDDEEERDEEDEGAEEDPAGEEGEDKDEEASPDPKEVKPRRPIKISTEGMSVGDGVE